MRQFVTCHKLWLVVIAYLVLAVIYSLDTPIFEASDEVSHYAVVQHIVDTGELPAQQPGVKTAWEQEGSQPPLYYLLASFVARVIDTRDAADRMYRNPHAAPGDPSLDANRNLIIHSTAEDFPWHNTTLAVHLIRFASIVMGAVTVAIGYALARRIFPQRPSIAIGAAMLTAFNPMFLFIAASVNNDNLMIVLVSLALYLSVECWQEPAGRVDRWDWWRRLALGIVLGGAALSKVSGLTLLPVAALMLTVRHLRERDWRGWILSGMLIAVPVLLIAGWWYVRNVKLYGELFGLNTMIAIAGPRTMTLLDLIPEFDGFRYSYWALFGAVNIVTFPLAYVIFDIFTLISVIGCVVWFIRNRRREQRTLFSLMLILAGYVLLVFISVIRWTMMTPASQGRLMFPAITVMSLLMWLGWETIFNVQLTMFNVQTQTSNSQPPISNFQPSASNWSKLRWTMPAFMLVTATIVPLRDIAPTYAGPQMMAEAQLPSDLKRLEVDYSDRLRLIGYRLLDKSTSSTSAAFTLYWQCLKSLDADYSVFVIMYGRNLQEVGKRDAFPYHGLYATRQCQPGQVFADPYRIPVNTAAERPTILRAQVGLKDWKTLSELAPTVNSQPMSSVMLDVGKLGPLPREHYATRNDRFGESIVLLDARVETLEHAPYLTLTWQAVATPPESYTTFVHILNAKGEQIGQADGPPLGDAYPTNWWSPGETIVDTRPLPLPPEADRVSIGLYRLADGVRLPIIDQAGQRMPNDEIVISARP